MSQALIDELTRFCLMKTDEYRMELLDMVDRLGSEEAAFQICWRTYQWPTGTPEHALDEFARMISLERLLEINQKHGISRVEEAVVGVARTIPRFNPHGGFAGLLRFFRELVSIAVNNGGSLVKYFAKFTDAKILENDLSKLPGIGPVLAPGIVRELRLADIIKLDIKNVNLSPADPVMRVLERTHIIPKDATLEEADKVVRMKFKVPPMALDAGLWHIGFYYCREKPECDICPIMHICPKCMEGEAHG